MSLSLVRNRHYFSTTIPDHNYKKKQNINTNTIVSIARNLYTGLNAIMLPQGKKKKSKQTTIANMHNSLHIFSIFIIVLSLSLIIHSCFDFLPINTTQTLRIYICILKRVEKEEEMNIKTLIFFNITCCTYAPNMNSMSIEYLTVSTYVINISTNTILSLQRFNFLLFLSVAICLCATSFQYMKKKNKEKKIVFLPWIKWSGNMNSFLSFILAFFKFADITCLYFSEI